MNPEWRTRYELALEATHSAGQFALQHFDTGLAVEWKSDDSPVTLADRGAEQLLREWIMRSFPQDGFLGEEFGEKESASGFRWIIDPIDGTRSFVRGVPLWATLVGLEYRGEQVAGVAYIPAMNLTYRALRGDGAYRNDRAIRVSTVDQLSKAHLYYSSLVWFQKAGREQQFIELVRRTERQRGFGDFYGFVLVAEGAGDVMLEFGVHPWDIAPLKVIVEEAGGRFSTWTGSDSIFELDVIASNGKLHEATLAILNKGV